MLGTYNEENLAAHEKTQKTADRIEKLVASVAAVANPDSLSFQPITFQIQSFSRDTDGMSSTNDLGLPAFLYFDNDLRVAKINHKEDNGSQWGYIQFDFGRKRNLPAWIGYALKLSPIPWRPFVEEAYGMSFCAKASADVDIQIEIKGMRGGVKYECKRSIRVGVEPIDFLLCFRDVFPVKGPYGLMDEVCLVLSPRVLADQKIRKGWYALSGIHIKAGPPK